MTIRPIVALLAIPATACLLTGCRGGTSDKAGGSQAPTVLRLGSTDFVDQSESPAIRYFAAQVARLSHGQLRIHIAYDAGGDRTADSEENVIRKVESGELDLGWIAARAWDEVGVKSFQALQAPFLITSYALLERVTTSPLAASMLDGLRGRNVVGLALVPMELRHPIGLEHTLESADDFRGARIRDIPSRVSDDLLRALGARPVHVGNNAIAGVVAHRRVDGSEVSLETAGSGSIVTANATFFAKAMTLFAGRKAFDALSAEQRTWLRTAAERTLPHVLAHPPWHGALARFCRNGGRVVLASRRDLTGLERASRPVSSALERDSQTGPFIAAIRRLKETTRPDPPLVIPPSCRQRPHGAAPATGKPRPPSIVNGTYHLYRTRADALAFGDPANKPESLKGLPSEETRVLNDGRWRYDGGLHGTYKIRGSRITFTSATGERTSFTFSLDASGTLRLKPVLPMDRGNRWVDAGEPWHRVGPPSPLP